MRFSRSGEAKLLQTAIHCLLYLRYIALAVVIYTRYHQTTAIYMLASGCDQEYCPTAWPPEIELNTIESRLQRPNLKNFSKFSMEFHGV